MSEVENHPGIKPADYLRDFSLEPVETARREAIRERDELRAEIDAFATFADQISELATEKGNTDRAIPPLLKSPAEFEEELVSIAALRQREIHNRSPRSRSDGHDVCTYLYTEYRGLT